SAPVAALTEGVLNAMLWAKCRGAAVVLLLVGLVAGAGGGGLLRPTRAAEGGEAVQKEGEGHRPLKIIRIPGDADAAKMAEELRRVLAMARAMRAAVDAVEKEVQKLEKNTDRATAIAALEQVEHELAALRKKMKDEKPPALK